MPDTALVPSASRDALRLALAALDAAEQRGQPGEMSLALAAVGRCYRELHALAAAEATLEAGLRWAHACDSLAPTVDLLCELAQTCAAALDAAADPGDDAVDAPGATRAARERARDHAYQAARLTAGADPAWAAGALLRISRVLERCGDREDAVHLQARAQRLVRERRGTGAGGEPAPAALRAL